MQTVLVTGGYGFIGGYVTEELVERGYDVILFDRVEKVLNLDIDDNQVTHFLGDIRDSAAVTEAMAHADGWIHLAGVLGTAETIKNPRPAAETNVLGGLNVLEAASQYDIPGVNIAVGNYWMNNTYSITKSTVERFAQMYRAERGLALNNVRAMNAYGPRQSVAAPYGNSKVRKIVPSFICRALAGAPIEIYGDGEQVMDMVYVTDVARDLVEALENTAKYGAFTDVLESGPGLNTTVNDVVVAVLNATGSLSDVVYKPMRPGEPEGSVVKADYPYGSFYTSLDTGIRHSVNYFRNTQGKTWSA